MTTLVETLPSLVRVGPASPRLPTATRAGLDSLTAASRRTVAGLLAEKLRLRAAAEDGPRLAGAPLQVLLVAPAHVREAGLYRVARLPGRHPGEVRVGVEQERAGAVEGADARREVAGLARVVGEVFAYDQPLRRRDVALATQDQHGDAGVVHDLLGLAAHKDALDGSDAPAADDQEPVPIS